MKDFYSENCKTVRKAMTQIINTWKHSPCLWTGRLNFLFKYQYQPKQSADSGQSLPKKQWCFFADIENPMLKFIWNFKGPWIPKQPQKRTKLEGLHSLISNLLRSDGHPSSVLLAQRQTDTQTKMNREPRNKSSHLWSNDYGPSCQGKGSLFDRWGWENWTFACESLNWGPT